MKNSIRSLIVILVLLFSFQIFAASRIFCRGPFGYSTNQSGTMLTFTSSSQRFTGNYRQLNPGECTWSDRLLGNGEPRKIWVSAYVKPSYDKASPAHASTLLCAHSETCGIMFNVMNISNKYFNSESDTNVSVIVQ